MKKETRTEEVTVAELIGDMEQMVNNKEIALNTKVRILLDNVPIPIEELGIGTNTETGEAFLTLYPSKFFINFSEFCKENVNEKSNLEETFSNFLKSLEGDE